MFSFITQTTVTERDCTSLLKIPNAAIILLKTKEEANIRKAEELLNILLDAQICSVDSEHYGLWIYQEGFSYKNSGTVDKNMTTYIGIPLFILLAEYSADLSEDLINRIEHALSLACIYILNRNIHLQYSHIVIAEGFLTAVCGEWFKNPEFMHYAMTLFQKFHRYNLTHGNFTEFNSPYYDTKSLSILYLAKKYIKNEVFLQLAEQISDSLWKIMAHHYHYNTGNIAGPCHRFHNLFISPENERFFADACTTTRTKNNELTFYNICPNKYRPYFDGRKQNWHSQEMVSHGSSYPYYLYPIAATTLMKPGYCIGTFNRSECWGEQAAFLGYFGTKKTPFAIRVTTLHDGHEFASAQLSIIQHMNYILGHTSFATNRGDKHISYDVTNGSIKAKDLRIRFLISGDIPKLDVSRIQNTLNIRHDDVNIKFIYSLAKFDNCKPRIELTCDKELYFDLVLYKGVTKKINFIEIKKAIISWMFCISEKTIPDFSIENKFKNNYLITKTHTDESIELVLESYYKPDTHENIHVNNKQYIQGILLEKKILKNSNMMQQYSYIINNNPDYSFNYTLKKGENIETLISALSSTDEENIISSAKEIFSLIYKNNVTLMLIKRFAIQIMTHVFEFYKEQDPRFETITHDVSEIYAIRIISATDTETIAHHIFELLNLMHSNYISFDNTETNQALIYKITELIDKEYNNPNLSLEYISNQFGEQTYTISRLFKKFYNLKYIDYLTNIRINHAKDYLTNSEYTLEEISSKIGYLCISSFIRAFKKKTGQTPKEYRKQN